jgi:Predicted metal-dependent hydrolase with the TIM-barrel fold
MPLFADLVATGGNCITLDESLPRASALAVRDGRLIYVGDDAGARALAGPQTRHVALNGRTVTPGFVDAHIHLLMYGAMLLRQVDLVGTADLNELLDRLSAHAARSPEGWIHGRGFDQDKMAERRFPTRADLDRVSTTRPILITRVCGHAAVANSAALALITPEERAAGDPETGLYTEGDIGAFYRRIPPLSEAQQEEAVLRASAVALRTGITSVHTLLDTPDQMGAYARLHRRGALPLRVTGMPPYHTTASLYANGVGTTFGDDWLRFGAAKFFSDGSLGARTALLAAPYADDPERTDNLGIRIYDPEDLKAKASDAHAKGFQIAIHAIGDQAVRETLDAIEAALGADGDNGWHRHRVEHVSLLAPDQRERMARRKIVAVVQPQFVTSDTWTGERVGKERSTWGYPFRSMLRAGIPLALSSDCPVESLDAFACLAAAVGRHAWSPDETLTPEEALRAYCLGGAFAAHAEDRLGSLEAGKLADFVVLSDDPTHLDAAGIRALKAEQVFVGGREVQRE